MLYTSKESLEHVEFSFRMKKYDFLKKNHKFWNFSDFDPKGTVPAIPFKNDIFVTRKRVPLKVFNTGSTAHYCWLLMLILRLICLRPLRNQLIICVVKPETVATIKWNRWTILIRPEGNSSSKGTSGSK